MNCRAVLLCACLCTTHASLATPCDEYPKPTLTFTGNNEGPIPFDVPVPLSSLFTLAPAPVPEMKYFGLGVRVSQFQTSYSIDGGSWSPISNTPTISFAGFDIKGQLTNGNYGTHWSAATITFHPSKDNFEKAPEVVNIGQGLGNNSWTLVYQLVKKGLSPTSDEWGCQWGINNNSNENVFSVTIGLPKVVMLDPAAFYPKGGASAKDLINKSKLKSGLVAKVAADSGTPALLVARLSPDSNVPVSFELEGDPTEVGGLESYAPGALSTLQTASSATSTATIIDGLLDAAGKPAKYAVAIYRSPTPKNLEAPKEAKINVKVGDAKNSMKITVRPPPVLFAHGVWDDRAAFSASAWNLGAHIQGWSRWDSVYDGLADYRAARSTIESEIWTLIEQERQAGLLLSSVDAVVHSMGGLVVREYAGAIGVKKNHLNRVPLHNFITLDTPHLGSDLARILLESVKYPDGSENLDAITGMCVLHGVAPPSNIIRRIVWNSDDTLKEFFEKQHKPISPAVASLQPAVVQSNATPPPQSIRPPTYISAVRGEPSFIMGNTLDLLLACTGRTGLDAALGGFNNHDEVVTRQSQEAFGSTRRFQSMNHTEVTEDDSVAAYVGCVLSGVSPCAASASVSVKTKANAPVAQATAPDPWVMSLDGYTLDSTTAIAIKNQTATPTEVGIGPNSLYLKAQTSTKTVQLVYAMGSDDIDRSQLYYRDQTGLGWTDSVLNVSVGGGTTFDVRILVLYSDLTFGIAHMTFPIRYGSDISELVLDSKFVILPSAGSTATLPLRARSNRTGQLTPFPLALATYALKEGSAAAVEVRADGTVFALAPGRTSVIATLAGKSIEIPVIVEAETLVAESASASLELSGVSFEGYVPTVDFGAGPSSGTPRERSVIIKSAGDRTLELGTFQLKSVPAALSVANNTCANAALAVGAQCELKLSFSSLAPGSLTGAIEFSSNDPVSPLLSIRLKGTVTTSSPPPTTTPPNQGGGSSGGGAGGGGGGAMDLRGLLALLLLSLCTKRAIVERRRGSHRVRS
jgi:pimeloyl-ACP methyl ester carboxylesterase